MYFGSIRFFRHLIVGIDLLLILGLAVSTAIFAVKANSAEHVLVTSSGTASYASESGLIDNPSGENISQSEAVASTTTGNLTDYAAGTPEFEYQSLYPGMYSEIPYAPQSFPKTVYLTFDDGPSPYTEEVLDILDKNNIKGTFFVVGNKITPKSQSLLRRMQKSGHAIGVHSYTHVYTDIYSSTENYLNDFYQTYQKVHEATEAYPDLFRFPGGSINSYNKINYQQIIAEMTRRNFIYFDWNVSSGDTSLKKSSAIVDYILSNLGNKSEPIILLHDTKSTTPEVLRAVIPALKEKGYQFGVLSKSVKCVSFAYPN